MTAVLLSETGGREALEWVRDRQWTGGFDVLVLTRPYTGRVEPEWCRVDGVKQGNGSPYPVKAVVPHENGGCTVGQFGWSDVLAVRAWDAAVMLECRERFGNDHADLAALVRRCAQA